MTAPAYVGDLEHDLQMIRIWAANARRATAQWMRGYDSARTAQRAVAETLLEMRRICLEIEKLERVEISILVWEAILVTAHLHDALGSEDGHIIHTADELLTQRELAIWRAVIRLADACAAA
jgi:hypothetical protein